MQFVLALVILILIYLFLVCPRLPRRSLQMPALIAHRGLHDGNHSVPENSLAAFESACAHGYAVELDVHLTADDQLVVFHDDDLKRCCGMEGNLHEMTLSQLRECRLFETDERIPTFDEVLDLIHGRVPILVELKANRRGNSLAKSVADRLLRYRGDYWVESFDPFILRALKAYPEIVRGQLVGRVHKGQGAFATIAMGAAYHLLINVLSRPDFIACELGMTKSFGIWVQRTLFHTPITLWTVRSIEQSKAIDMRKYAVIFEQFDPRA